MKETIKMYDTSTIFSNAKLTRSDQRVENILIIISLSRTCYKTLVPVQQQQYKQQINKTNCIGVSQGQIRTRKRSQPTNHVRKKVTNHDWILVGSFWPYPASCSSLAKNFVSENNAFWPTFTGFVSRIRLPSSGIGTIPILRRYFFGLFLTLRQN